MVEINGVELLYSKFYPMAIGRFVGYMLIGIAIVGLAGIIITLTKDKDWREYWWTPIVWTLLFLFIISVVWVNTYPFTEYYVKIDDSALFNPIVNEYGVNNIHHIDNDIYRLTVTNYGD